MAGGLMQLVAYGAQDVYLTGNPQITFFKVVYRRHTNFSMECIELSMNGNPNFGRRNTVCITRNGDLITKVYLQVKLDAVKLSSGAKFAWVKRLGYALIKSVELDIGGSKIDKQYGTWLNVWYELARDAGDKERGFAHMIGDVPELTEYNEESKPEYQLFVPLKFWFNRHVGLALPLIALQYHEVRLHFEFSDIHRLFVSNNKFRHNDIKCLGMKDAQLLVDYIYLDSEERRRFAQVGHEYLIEQLQFTGEESAQTATGKYKLDFNHPTKELVWLVRNGNFTAGNEFVYYTGADDWESKLNDASEKILRESIALVGDNRNTSSSSCSSSSSSSTNACFPSSSSTSSCDSSQSSSASDAQPTSGCWEEFPAGTCGCTVNGKVYVRNECGSKSLWVNTSSLAIGNYNITGKICAEVLVCDEDNNANDVKIHIIKTGVTVRDLSFPVSALADTRARRDDAHVHQFNNYGVLIDGSGNPVHFGLIQLNGQDRFDRREGAYFNYVQPDQHHTNTPADGVNVYSFALHPEQHQPSGSANLSRIDNTQLNLWFHDPTQRHGLPHLSYLLNPENKLFIYGYNYNVLRVMSGMGGLAYAN